MDGEASFADIAAPTPLPQGFKTWIGHLPSAKGGGSGEAIAIDESTGILYSAFDIDFAEDTEFKYPPLNLVGEDPENALYVLRTRYFTYYVSGTLFHVRESLYDCGIFVVNIYDAHAGLPEDLTTFLLLGIGANFSDLPNSVLDTYMGHLMAPPKGNL